MAVVGKNPIAEGNFHGFLPVTVKALNSYSKSFTSVDRTKEKTVAGDRTKTKTPPATEVSRIAELLRAKILEQNGLLTFRAKWPKLDASSNDLIQSRSGKGVAGRKNEGKKSEKKSEERK